MADPIAQCPYCGYQAKDEADFLAHLTECEHEPETKWGTYSEVVETGLQPFKNSEILEEE